MKTYLPDNKQLFELIKEIVQDQTINLDFEREVEEIECKSRDGFIPASDNCGGFEKVGFTDVGYIIGSGYYPKNESANKEIARQYEYNRKLVKEQNPELEESSDDFFEKVFELSLEDSIMYSIRIMYHGVEKGIHSFSVSAVVNTEGPYHRSSISWMPDLKCEHGAEVEVTGRTLKSIEKKLRKALAKLVKENL